MAFSFQASKTNTKTRSSVSIDSGQFRTYLHHNPPFLAASLEWHYIAKASTYATRNIHHFHTISHIFYFQSYQSQIYLAQDFCYPNNCQHEAIPNCSNVDDLYLRTSDTNGTETSSRLTVRVKLYSGGRGETMCGLHSEWRIQSYWTCIMNRSLHRRL